MAELAGAGRFDGKVHILPVRIYYEDTDLSGIVYHANYLRYMERGRSEFFRSAGIKRLAMLEQHEATAWTLRRISLAYMRPARLDDLIEVHTRATSLTGARMMADQKIYCGGQLLTHGEVEACIITLDGKPRRIPADIREKLQPFVMNEKTERTSATDVIPAKAGTQHLQTAKNSQDIDDPCSGSPLSQR
ncbi:MAG TPA: YbgC/FadM family acyl-CoA thioesterase [Rhizomicrobium sp.]|nr:YbgC/FadM family acyl-CoA thioesterase [Rhizomicrobium sp.]